MSLIDHLHDRYVHTRRVRVLSDHLAKLIPQGVRVLDVGCGDGLVSHLIMKRLPNVQLRGIDVLVRKQTYIPVDWFDGRVIPYGERSFDLVMLVDMLHHTDNPMIPLREAVRVARRAILIKDVTCDGVFAGPTLRFMDWVGNARHGVALPYNYWLRRQWCDAFDALGLRVAAWEQDLKLYPPPLEWVFGRSFHFIARLDVAR